MNGLTISQSEWHLAALDTVQQVDRIAFFYPDGSHNAEAFLVDPKIKDIYIITKTDLHSKQFKLTIRIAPNK